MTVLFSTPAEAFCPFSTVGFLTPYIEYAMYIRFLLDHSKNIYEWKFALKIGSAKIERILDKL